MRVSSAPLRRQEGNLLRLCLVWQISGLPADSLI
nr:MAG TPA: hypothetical protein [Caudoviricetes sp.]